MTQILQATTLEVLGYNLVGAIATLVFLGFMRLDRKSRTTKRLDPITISYLKLREEADEMYTEKEVEELLNTQHRNTVFDAVELVKDHIKKTGRYDDRELQTKIANLKIRKP